MDLPGLLIIFIILVLATLFTSYHLGLMGGLLGVVILSLYLTWGENLLRNFGHPNAATTKPFGLKRSFRAFLKHLSILLFCFYGVNHIITWIKTGDYDLMGFSIWLFLVSAAYVYLRWYRIKSSIASRYELWLYKKQVRLKEKEKKAIREEMERLESAYCDVLKNKTTLKKYLYSVNKISRKSAFIQTYAKNMAVYTSKLIMHGIDANDYSFAINIFNNYINNVFPRSGSCGNCTNVAGNALCIGILANDQDVIDKVFNKLLGKDFDITKTDQEFLLFNLACYYAIQKNKPEMLRAIRQALLHGKKAEQFMTDSDFKDYWVDTDFINVLKYK